MLLWFCCPLRPAPRSALTSLSTLLSTTSSHLLPSPSPRVCSLWSCLAFPPHAVRPSLCLGAQSASRLLGPSPPHSHALQPSRSVGGIGLGRSVPSSSSSILAGGLQVRAWRPPYSCPRLPGGRWGIKKRSVCVKDCRITAEKVLTWGQPQAKPFYNQSGNQAGPRRDRNKWAQRGGGEAGSPGKQRQGKDRVASSSRQNWVPGNSGAQAGSRPGK